MPGPRARGRKRAAAMAVLLIATASAAAACSALPMHVAAGPASQMAVGPNGNALPAATVELPSPAVSVLASTAPDELTAAFAGRLFSAAPVVVVAASGGTALAAGERAAVTAHAPLLLVHGTVSAALFSQLKNLRPRAVLAVGVPPAALAAQLPGVAVETSAAMLPATGTPAPLRGVAVLMHRANARAVPNAAIAAVTIMARVAGVPVVTISGYDPRADPGAIVALAKAGARAVVAIGRGFGPAGTLAARVAVAATGRQLPGGGQVMFPGRRLIALYGHPDAPSLGVLGHQDLSASIARARRVADQYRSLSTVPVVPAFEIIATVAQASPGWDGTYSYASSVASLRPWVRQATAAGMYVVLDLQPGRASLLTQAKLYTSLLTQPDVGLALDAEWKLQPGQLPLHQIGSVSVAEVNSVIRWLAALTASHHLPQKLLVLHQFRLSMLADEPALDTSHDDLAIVIHMDGQGTPRAKEGTWGAVTGAAPPRVFFGWKNFYVKDHPMFGPQATMSQTPAPVMISYQ